MSSRFGSCRRSTGFTLIELMVVISIAVILLGIAVPNLRQFITSSSVRGTQAEFVSALMLARNEAARQGKPITVAATAPVANNEFGAGWIVWYDANNNNVFDAANEKVIRRYQAKDSSVVISTGGNASFFVFRPNGFLQNMATSTVTVCAVNVPHQFVIGLQAIGLVDVSEAQSNACP